MIVETLTRSVHCDRCSNSTEGFNQFDTIDFKLPTAQKIRDWFGFRRVKADGKFIDLCPACYAKYKSTNL